MKPILANYQKLEDLVQKSLSISPYNINQSLRLDNLSEHSGYVQHTVIKNNKDFEIDKENKKKESSVLLDADKIVEKYNVDSLNDKLKYREELHNEAQVIIGDIIDDIKCLIKKYPNKYQAQLANEAGLTRKLLNDKNFVFATFANMMVDQDILTKYKEDGHSYYKIKNDIDYTPFAYVDTLKYASKLEALTAQTLKDLNVDFRQQVKLKGLGNLRIDFEVNIDGYLLYLEVDGKQHYEWIKHFHKTYDDFEKAVSYDRKKDRYALDNDLDFLRLRYDQDIPRLVTKKIYDVRNSQK